MQIGRGKSGVRIGEYGSTKDGLGTLGWIEPACDHPQWILWFTDKGDAILYTSRDKNGGVLGDAIDIKARGTGKKCEALHADEGGGWSLCKFPRDSSSRKYHQCNAPAVIRVVNEYEDIGGPSHVWLCAACDKKSRVK